MDSPALLKGLTPLALGGRADGTVNFNSRSPEQAFGIAYSTIDPVTGMSVLKGFQAPWVIQLYGGPSLQEMIPASTTALFDTNAWAGYWTPKGDGIVTLTNVAAGDMAYLELRIWDSSQAASYEAANSRFGRAVAGPIRVRTGGAGTPPSPPALLTGIQTVLSFQEPRYSLIRFRNFVPGQLDNPVIGPDGNRLSGTNFVAQLFTNSGANSTEQFVPLSLPAPFGVGSEAGYWQPGANDLYSVEIPSGCCTDVQVQVWDYTQGTTYESATNGLRAISQVQRNFADGREHLLTNLGMITLRTSAYPCVTLSQDRSDCWITSYLGHDWYRTGFVGQVYFSLDNTNYAPAGQVFTIGAGTNAGFWEGRDTRTVELHEAPPGQVIYLQIRFWQQAKGASYEEARQNDSLLGRSDLQLQFKVPFPEEPPPAIVVSRNWISASLKGRTRKFQIPPGISLWSSPFVQGRNLFMEVNQPDLPPGLTFYQFDPATQSYLVMIKNKSGRWSHSGYYMLSPGDVFFVHNPINQPLEFTFEGEEGQPARAVRPSGNAAFVTVGGTQPQPTPLASLLGIPLMEGDTAYKFQNNQWQQATYRSANWIGFNPILAPGEAVFVRLQSKP